jgi:hypothetical protein
MRTLWQRTFKLRVAINMLFCAFVLGAFGSVPRETISGFLGRRGMDVSRSAVWYWLMRFVDALHPHESGHCQRVAAEELEGWMAMYPERFRKQAPKAWL